MKREISISTWATLGSIAIWIVTTAVYFGVTVAAGSDFNGYLTEAFETSALARAKAASYAIAPEVTAQDTGAVLEKLKIFVKEKTGSSISVISEDNRLLHSTLKKERQKKMLAAAKGMHDNEVFAIDDALLASVSVPPGAPDSAPRLVYEIPVARYRGIIGAFWNRWSLAALFCLVLLVAVAILVGRLAVRPIKSLTAAAEQIGDGDLTHTELGRQGARAFTRLGESISRLGQTLNAQVSEVKSLTDEIAVFSNRTKGTMSTLATSATEQAAAVNETAATVEEMEKAGQSAAGNAKMIVSAAEKTAEASQRGRQTVEKTYEIIMQIREDSQDISEKSRNLLNSVEEIGTIIQSVNSIAEQSKILAVNASIEAAKAGEFGSGFAVVAQEVKELAQQSKDATLQITETLTAIREAIEKMVATAQNGKERTEEGVNTISNAGAVMNDLSEAIRENSEFANIIATNIKQQTVGLTQIATAVEQINTTAMESQNVSRSTAEDTAQMNVSIKMLADLMERWRVSENKIES